MFIQSNIKQCIASVWIAFLMAATMVSTSIADAAGVQTHARPWPVHGLMDGQRDSGRHDDERDHRDVRALGPHAIVAGKTIGAWTEDWWIWAFSFVQGQSPVFDDQTGELGYLGDVGGPVFFVGAFTDEHRSFDVPCGKYLLFPMFTANYTIEGTDTETDARALAKADVDAVTGLFARVDGNSVPNLFAHREPSPSVFTIVLPKGGLFDPDFGAFESVADGYWLMLKPLSPGPHRIRFGATGTPSFGDFDYRAILDLNVTGRCRNH